MRRNSCSLLLGAAGGAVSNARSSLGRYKAFLPSRYRAHVRFLVSLPVLIMAEMVVHLRIEPMMKRFVERHVVIQEELPKFYSAIGAAVVFTTQSLPRFHF